MRYHKKVFKFLAKCPQYVARKFYDISQELAQKPHTTKYDIKKYTEGGSNHYRLRIGGYRFLYEIIDHEIVIYFYESDSRGDVYK